MAWLGFCFGGRALDVLFSQFFVVVVVVVGQPAGGAAGVAVVVGVVFSLPEAGASVFLAEGPTALRIETLSFQITSADLGVKGDLEKKRIRNVFQISLFAHLRFDKRPSKNPCI